MSDRQGNEFSRGNQYTIQPYAQSDVPSTYVNYQAPEEEVHLRDYLGIILKRKWVVLTFLLSVMVITMTITFAATPLYRSTAVIKIGEAQNSSDPLKILQTSQQADYYQTQYEILKSDTLAERVIRKLELDKNPDFGRTDNVLLQAVRRVIYSVVDGVFSLISLVSVGDDHAKEVEVHRPRSEMPLYLINSFLSSMDVAPVKNSQLVQVSFSSSSPELAQNVAKAIADAYIGLTVESRVDTTTQAKEFLSNQLELTKTKLEDSEEKLNKYASKNGVIYLDGDKQSVLVQKLSEITSALSAATNDRMQREALYKQIKESGDDNPVIMNNSLILGLKKQYATLEAEYFNKLRTFTPDYPAMKNLKSEMDAIQRSIQKEKTALVEVIISDYKAAEKKETYLSNAFEAQKRNILDFQDNAAEYQTLKREVDVNKQLQKDLLQKFNEVNIAAMSQATNIQILDYPRYPMLPDTPKKTRNFFLSLVFGLMGGIGLAFLIEYFDYTIRDTREIEKRTNLPSLGMVPFHAHLGSPEKRGLAYSGITRSVSEAFRSIGTFILLSSPSKPPKTILVTSPGEKEGKTTVCINVALALSDSIGNGLLIDADMRKPKLHRAFNLDNKTGLSGYLSGNMDLDVMNGKLIRQTHLKELSIITAGPVPPNPAKLLHSPRMKELLDILYARYNFVIIDATPVLGIPDGVLLSRIVDGTILVVRAGETPKNALSTTRQIFSDVNTNLLGVVLNGVKKDDLRFSYHYGYYSSYFEDEAAGKK
jgi:succinoglycan biosynthesis transport protein ExoP